MTGERAFTGSEKEGAVEYGWFCQTFGRATELLPFDERDENADLRVAPGGAPRTCWRSTAWPGPPR